MRRHGSALIIFLYGIHHASAAGLYDIFSAYPLPSYAAYPRTYPGTYPLVAPELNGLAPSYPLSHHHHHNPLTLADYFRAETGLKYPREVDGNADEYDAAVGAQQADVLMTAALNASPQAVAAAAELLAQNQNNVVDGTNFMTEITMAPSVVRSGDVVTMPTGEMFLPMMLRIPLLIQIPQIQIPTTQIPIIASEFFDIDQETNTALVNNNELNFNVPVIATDVDGSVIVTNGINFQPGTFQGSDILTSDLMSNLRI
eukprot:Selendium_serpulae@DN383_c0_g1_i1.p1